jgi:hypothetical protein
MAAWQSPTGGSRPVPIGSRSIGVSLQPAVPRRVAPQQSPPPLHRSPTTLAHLAGASNALARPHCKDNVSALVVLAATRVSSLLCTPGDISILRRQVPVRVRVRNTSAGNTTKEAPVSRTKGNTKARLSERISYRCRVGAQAVLSPTLRGRIAAPRVK